MNFFTASVQSAKISKNSVKNPTHLHDKNEEHKQISICFSFNCIGKLENDLRVMCVEMRKI